MQCFISKIVNGKFFWTLKFLPEVGFYFPKVTDDLYLNVTKAPFHKTEIDRKFDFIYAWLRNLLLI